MNLFYTAGRSEWRAWLEANFETEREVWFVFPMKDSGEESMSYNDAVEEALCFGWIDSTIKHIDPLHRAQRFTPRRKGSPYSQPNIERLVYLERQGLLHPKLRERVLPLLQMPYVFPEEILAELRKDPAVWDNYLQLPEPYRRIRVAYIDAAKDRPEEYLRRLHSLTEKTRKNQIIRGHGGIDRYYGF